MVDGIQFQWNQEAWFISWSEAMLVAFPLWLGCEGATDFNDILQQQYEVSLAFKSFSPLKAQSGKFFSAEDLFTGIHHVDESSH